MIWKVVGAIAPGTSHLESSLPCQDRYLTTEFTSGDGGAVLALAVSDGAGSAERSETGATTVCSTLIACTRDALAVSSDLDQIGDELVRSWFIDARAAIRILARDEDGAINDYAATGLLAVVADHQALCAQVGDGAMVIRGRDANFTVAIWPEGGEYANETFFVTDPNVATRVHVRRFDGVRDVIAFSDGLQRLALHSATKSAYAPFFEQIVRTVRDEERTVDDLMNDLTAYLGSAMVNARTDDDKSLVIGCRL